MRRIGPLIVATVIVVTGVLVQLGHAETCDFDDSALKKLCRKVESQDKYLEKIVDIGYKTETMFKWFSANKEWLTSPRLSRMMKRLLRRAASLNPGESDDFTDDSAGSTNPSSTSTGGVESLEIKLEQLAVQLNLTQNAIKLLPNSGSTSDPPVNRGEDWRSLEQRLDATLTSQVNLTNRTMQQLMDGGEQLSKRVAKAEKLLQTLQSTSGSCGCTAVATAAAPAEAGHHPVDELKPDGIIKIKHELANEIEQLQLKLQLTASDLEKSIGIIQKSSEGALRNFSIAYHEGMKTLTTMMDDRLTAASSSSYDTITNATLAFGEDLQVLRQAVSQSASQIQFLIGQDLKTVRGLEEVRSGTRRHEANINVVTTQLGELKFQVQDQLNNLRGHFTQTVNEFYNKIVERQNAMSYRLSSVVDELSAIKGKVRNIPVIAPATAGSEGSDDDPIFTPPAL